MHAPQTVVRLRVVFFPWNYFSLASHMGSYIDIVQLDTNGILTALYIVIKYIQTQYMHKWTHMKYESSFIKGIHTYAYALLPSTGIGQVYILLTQCGQYLLVNENT